MLRPVRVAGGALGGGAFRPAAATLAGRALHPVDDHQRTNQGRGCKGACRDVLRVALGGGRDELHVQRRVIRYGLAFTVFAVVNLVATNLV